MNVRSGVAKAMCFATVVKITHYIGFIYLDVFMASA